eukprot:scaffold561_cov380-Pavlova_lutheri.AAC.3
MLRTYEKTEATSRRGLGGVEAGGAHQVGASGKRLTACHAPPSTGRHAQGRARGSHVRIRRLYELVRSSRQSR